MLFTRNPETIVRFAVRVVVALLVVGVVFVSSVVASQRSSFAAVVLPAGFQDTVVATGLNTPTAIAFTPDGRILVAERNGDLRIVKDGLLLPEPFLSVNTSTSGERGLLGVAVAPDFAVNGYVYVYYTQPISPGFPNRISRFTVAQTGIGDTADPNSEVVMLDSIIGRPEGAFNHNGGSLQFGADGMLYVGIGDFETRADAQDPTNLPGSILRLDVANYPAVIPGDNPDWGVPGARGEIWAIGVRNPFTLAADSVSGNIHINDVGELSWEEINLGVNGANYGWPGCEGACSPPDPLITDPIHQYARGSQAAIIGGDFYRAAAFPAQYHGDYFFTDFLQGFINVLNPDNTVEGFATGVTSGPVSLKMGPDGALYYTTLFEGSLHKISFVGDGNFFPVAVAAADVTTSQTAPLTVQFDGTGSSDPDVDALIYSWDFDDGSAVETGISVSHTFTSQGGYDVQLTVEDGNGGIAFDAIRIEVGTPPSVFINSPVADTPYAGGQEFTAAGSAIDLDDGALGPAALSWVVLFHHAGHAHPFIPTASGVSDIAFTIKDRGEVDTDVWYRIYLTATDSSGLSTTVTGDLLPIVSTLSIESDPAGLGLEFDSSLSLAPFEVAGVAGVFRTVNAPSPQDLAGTQYNFTGWSDAGSQFHEISFPTVPGTLSASYSTTEPPTPTPTPTPTSVPPPGIPSLLQPGDGVTTPDNTPAFTWSTLPEPGVSYEMQIDTSALFDAPLDIDVMRPTPDFTIPDGQELTDGTYFWRVRGALAGSNFGDWSAVRTFTVMVGAQSPVLLTSQVSSGSDDAYSDPDSWPGYSDSTTFIYAGRPGLSEPVVGGFRFTSLGIPQNAVISAAYVELTQSGWGNIFQTTLTFEGSAFPETFSASNTPSDRSSTSFSVDWTWPRETPGTLIQTPSLIGGIQELVDTHGGIDALVLLELGTLATTAVEHHTWASFESDPTDAAIIHIEYVTGGDTSPPLLSNGAPTGTLPAGTTSTLISMSTDEDATCRRDSVPGTVFSLMPDLFTTTGSTAHSILVTGLSDGDTVTHYVRCEDGSGNANAADFVISFSIAVSDLVPPVTSNPLPTGSLPAGTVQAVISVETDEAANCKYGTVPGEDYDSVLLSLFSTTGGTVHTSTVTGLENDTAYTYYARCQDLSGNAQTTDTVISFSVLADLAPPVMSNGGPTGVLPSGTVQATLSAETNEPSSCGYSVIPGTVFGLMTPFTSTGAVVHSTQVGPLSDDTAYTYYVRCEDSSGNANITDLLINFAVASSGPVLLTSQVSSGSDDAYSDPDGWPGYSDSSTFIYAGRPGLSEPVVGGFRFTGLGIPQNAVISAAYVELTQSGWGNIFQTTLAFEGSAFPETFSASNTPSDRSSTSFSVDWTWPRATPGTLIQTPSLIGGIQELVDTHGGIDALVLLELGTLATTAVEHHTWASFESDPTDAAIIHIEYFVP